jgi:hypothetical protein
MIAKIGKRNTAARIRPPKGIYMISAVSIMIGNSMVRIK